MIERIIFKLARGCQRLRKGEGEKGGVASTCTCALYAWLATRGKKEKEKGKEKQAERAHAWPCQGVSA